MKKPNWIRILSILKTTAMLVWAFAFFSDRLNWFVDSETLTPQVLKNLKYFGIFLYFLFYQFELRLSIKQKNAEIAKLKTKLLQYEK